MLKYTDYSIVFSEIPDEVTLAINLSNCPNKCKGCHSPWLMDDIGEELTNSALSNLIQKYEDEITCICFMGGDIDPKRVNELAQYIHDDWNQINVGWYSGKSENPDCISVKNFQYIKLGGYKEHLGGLNSPQTNQRLYKCLPNGEKVDITFKFQKKQL
ncbi:MAG TPA: anaerobic ribonucleoside-triphosphate reductase activating protein [Paludibacteraceae bacterium]|nr:anaerobic ribonucleoside-triphosphate reductase activating protein [Paludibacteraceae bacterium]HPH62349.1 anaerobic ribonucleoside-triphosphate reductase activating protein [Paludibacteraceae bacterium]